MRKRLLTVLAVSAIALTACTGSDKGTTDGETTTQEASSASSDEQNNADVGNNDDAEIDAGVYAVIPKEFTEAVQTENTYRQAISQDISKVEKDAAQSEAFEAMLQLKDKYADALKEKLNAEQKELFESYLEAEKEFNAYFDMVSQNGISAYVYAGGSASGSEAYNLARLETVMLYYYSNITDGTEVDEAAYKELINANLEEFMFYTDKDFDWSQDDTAGIYEESKTELLGCISEDSKTAIDEYDAAYENFKTALTAFENSVGMEASGYYSALNAAIFSSLSESAEALVADETQSHLVKETSLESGKDDFMARWSYTVQANQLTADQLAAAKTAAEEYYAGTVMEVVSMELESSSKSSAKYSVVVKKDDQIQEVPRTISLRLTEDTWEVTGEGY